MREKRIFNKIGNNSFKLNEDWSPEELKGFKTKRDLGNMNGVYTFKSNSGVNYIVDFASGEIVSVKTDKGEVDGFNIKQANDYWNQGLGSLTLAIVSGKASNTGDSHGDGEDVDGEGEEDQMLYPPEELER